MTKYRNVLPKLGESRSLTDGCLKSTLISYETGKKKLERALQVARQKEVHDYVACCYTNLVFFCMQFRQYTEAQHWLEEGLEYTISRDLDFYSVYLLGWQAQLCFATGRWDEAEKYTFEAVCLSQNITVTLLLALLTLGHWKVWQGDEQAKRAVLTVFEQFGVQPAADVLIKELHTQGVKDGPRRQRHANQNLIIDLTVRELEVLWLIADGLSNPAIAERLIISVGTVKAHTASIYRKLGVKNRVQALTRAQDLHLHRNDSSE